LPHRRTQGQGGDGGEITTSRLAIVGESDTRADDLLIVRSGDERRGGDEAEDLLRAELILGPQPAKNVRAAARELGIAERTLERAKARLGVTSQRVGGVAGGGCWQWALAKAANSCESDGGLSDGGLSENPALERDSGNVVPLTPPSRESGGLRDDERLDEAEERRLRDEYSELW
jgi:hypothetical protein